MTKTKQMIGDKPFPKVLAYYPLHYGAEYLDASIRSIDSLVDKIVILYTEKPSYGFTTDIPCPETEDQLKQIAFNASEKIVWEKVSFGNEGEHRHHIWQYAEGYDLILACDGDEVYNTEDLNKALYVSHYYKQGKYIGISGFLNFWRSFNYVLTDGFTPIRIYRVNGDDSIKGETIDCTIYHFSCAQSEQIMRYKYAIHGHKEEIRPNWLEGIYFGWKDPSQRMLHPVSEQVWHDVTPFDKNTLPKLLKDHPNFDKEVI